MYFDEHNPPHFHAIYAGNEAQIGIDPIVTLGLTLRNDQSADRIEPLELGTMLPRVEQVRHLEDYRLELRFTDGAIGKIDFRNRIVGRGGVFGPLADLAFFRKVRVDPEAGTIVWPNDVDFCPDVLYSLATGEPIRSSEAA